MPSPNNVNQYLNPSDFPATKEEILARARERGAPVNVMADLERLPERRFESEGEVFTS